MEINELEKLVGIALRRGADASIQASNCVESFMVEDGQKPSQEIIDGMEAFKQLRTRINKMLPVVEAASALVDAWAIDQDTLEESEALETAIIKLTEDTQT